MAEWKEKLSSWWESRPPQERRTLKIAMPIIALMFLYLVLVEPIMSAYFTRKNDHAQAQETLTWLYEQAPLVARMQNSCGNRVYYLQDGEEPQALAQSIARRSSINASFQPNGESLAVTVSSAPGNRLLAYVQSLACNGFQIDGLEIQRSGPEATTVSASLLVNPVALPRSQ